MSCILKNNRKSKSFLNLFLSLSVHEREVAELFIVKLMQQDYFGELYSYINALRGNVCHKVTKNLKHTSQPLKNF